MVLKTPHSAVTLTVGGSSTFTAANLDHSADSTFDYWMTSTKRSASIFADTLYGAGSNITALNATNISVRHGSGGKLGNGSIQTQSF